MIQIKFLTLTEAKYLGAAGGTNPLCCRAFILEGNRLRIPNLHFLSTLHAIGLWHFLDLLSPSCQAE